MRLFIAINFPDTVKSAIAKVRNDLQASALHGNFSFDENLHLTLVFLGECNTRQLQNIMSVMDDTRFAELTLTIERSGYFKRDSGNTWWVGLKENKSLSVLQADLTKRLQQKGFTLESRKYRPHVTIGREVKMRAEFVHPEVPQVSFKVTGVELMKSERINGKLVYTPIKNCTK